MAKAKISSDELLLDVDAYYEHGGNRSEAARARGHKPNTYRERLKMAERRLGVKLGKVVDGRIDMVEMAKMPLPKSGHVARYILSSIQNNTHLHPGFNNLMALNDWLDNLENGTSQLIVGTYSYQLATYGPKAVKRGKHLGAKVHAKLWYAGEAEQYILDENVALAPGLVWCGDQNILPTTKHPLTDFEEYNGRKSNIVPHAKIAMESVASMADQPTKFNYSTGTVTQRNYIQKRAGILAEQKHTYGALLAEVDSDGNWWVRQLHIDEDDAIMDVGPDGYEGIYVQGGQVRAEHVTEGLYWGDAHPPEMEAWARKLGWGEGGMLDTLRPPHQFMGDIFSMSYRSPHEAKNYKRLYELHVEGEECVEDEIQLTADFLVEASRPWCETKVVAANHDRHLDRWLNEADFRKDPINGKIFVELWWQIMDAIDRGDKDFNILEWALKSRGADKAIRFLSVDENFRVAGIENALHGDIGINGGPGSTQGLTKLGIPVNKAHDHKAAIRGLVYSAAACAMNFQYTKGPNSRSISHIATYKNGKRAILTMWMNKWRA